MAGGLASEGLRKNIPGEGRASPKTRSGESVCYSSVRKAISVSGSPVSKGKVLGDETREGGSSQTILGGPLRSVEYSRTCRKLLQEGAWLDFYFQEVTLASPAEDGL